MSWAGCETTGKEVNLLPLAFKEQIPSGLVIFVNGIEGEGQGGL